MLCNRNRSSRVTFSFPLCLPATDNVSKRYTKRRMGLQIEVYDGGCRTKSMDELSHGHAPPFPTKLKDHCIRCIQLLNVIPEADMAKLVEVLESNSFVKGSKFLKVKPFRALNFLDTNFRKPLLKFFSTVTREVAVVEF
ncbi:hypothetical protein Tco_1234636 [Tanacetum coccineum]